MSLRFCSSSSAASIKARLYCEVISSEFRSRVKVEVAVLGFPGLIVRAVSVDVKQQ